MRASIVAAAMILSCSPALAQVVDWATATPVTVTLSSFAYAPSAIRLPADRPVRLVLTNAGGGGHNFAAPAFFEAATIRTEDRTSIRRGTVEVRGRTSITITLVPRAGRYPLRCTHFLHSGFGMTGEIVVE